MHDLTAYRALLPYALRADAPHAVDGRRAPRFAGARAIAARVRLRSLRNDRG